MNHKEAHHIYATYVSDPDHWKHMNAKRLLFILRDLRKHYSQLPGDYSIEIRRINARIELVEEQMFV